jgi:hypothetical protein
MKARCPHRAPLGTDNLWMHGETPGRKFDVANPPVDVIVARVLKV